MAYTPTLWAKGDIVTSEKLNKIEQGIVDKVDKVNGKTLSTNDFTNEDKAKLDGIESQINHLESLVGSPLVASTVAEMTDEDKVYVYTGSETGYQSGNWYYYNGTSWVSGGVYNSVAFETDDTLSIQGMPADAKKTGDELFDLKEGLNNLSSGKIAIDLIESQKQKGDIYSNIRFEEGYTVNSSNGTIGSTSNMRYFATNVALKESAIVIGCEKIIVKCNIDYIARFTYAFFDRDHNSVGSVVTINPVASNKFEITIPDGAYYLHCGGYGTTTANTPTACTTTFVYGITSFFVDKMDEQLTSEMLPAQGKATGTRIGALETLKDTTGLSKLRVITNANNINFVARTGLTNLFVGYGAGANSVEDYPDGTMNNLNTYDGSFNVAVGFEAMNANVGGDHCTAVGYTALKQNINGDYNTCMGEDALYNNQYGSYNIAIGDHALMSNEGESNIAIGASVARSITGVDDSIMVGSYAGVNMSGSKHNIAIGNRSGVTSGVTNNCIVIGNDASATENKQIVIGTSAQESVVIAGKRINFNSDGTVTWESLGV